MFTSAAIRTIQKTESGVFQQRNKKQMTNIYICKNNIQAFIWHVKKKKKKKKKNEN